MQRPRNYIEFTYGKCRPRYYLQQNPSPLEISILIEGKARTYNKVFLNETEPLLFFLVFLSSLFDFIDFKPAISKFNGELESFKIIVLDLLE